VNRLSVSGPAGSLLRLGTLFLGVLFSGPWLTAQSAVEPGLAQLHLARSFESLQWSSWDRSGRNSDHGNFEKVLEGGEKLLGAIDGPGRIVRIWSAQPKGILTLKDGERILYEGAFSRVFDGAVAPFVGPLSGHFGGGYLSYVPVAFEKGLVATLRSEQPGGDLDCYYQIGLERHASLPLADAASLLQGYREHNDDRRIEWRDRTLRGEAVLAELKGPGLIRELRFRFRHGDLSWRKRQLRTTMLEIYWDGEKRPAVRAALGDFLGIGPEDAAIQTLPVDSVGDARVVRFPMPFAKSARIVLRKEGQRLAPPRFDARVTWQSLAAMPKPARWFHAYWSYERTKAAVPLNGPAHALPLRGPGHFVGLFAVMESAGRNLFFLEGDETIYVDGQVRFRGTGTEDYFNGAWYFRTDTFAAPFHALALKNAIEGRVTVARWHLPDPIPFEESFRFELEHGGENDSPGHAYGLLQCFYLASPAGQQTRVARMESGPSPSEPLAYYLPDRGPRVVEGERMSRGAYRWVPPGRSLELSGGALARIPAGRSGQIELDVVPGPYLLQLNFEKLATAARARLSLGRATHELEIPADRATTLRLPNVLVPVSKPDTPPRLRLDVLEGELALDAIRFERWEERLRDWELCGPFPSPDREGFDAKFGPEQFGAAGPPFDVLGNGPKGWFRPKQAQRASGYFNLNEEFAPNEEVVAYARTTIHSKAARKAMLALGSDDGVKVWLNGHFLHQNKVLRGAHPEQDRVELHLREGANVLLLKIEEIHGGWGFYATLR
jgi:hypothetical protein